MTTENDDDDEGDDVDDDGNDDDGDVRYLFSRIWAHALICWNESKN